MKNTIRPLLMLITLWWYATSTTAQSRLTASGLFTDHMVLQQKQHVAIWGNSVPGSQVRVRSTWGKEAMSYSDSTGRWLVKLATPAAGGPYELTVSDSISQIKIHDILIGEVWLASGQSNMDIQLSGWPPGDTIYHAKEEIAQANYPEIRFFKVPFKVSATPLRDVSSTWLPLSPETASGVSATAYFYARQLHRELHVPIGIIQSAIGGTPAEAWTSSGGLSKLGGFDAALSEISKRQALADHWYKSWPVLKKPASAALWKTIDFKDTQAAKADFADTEWSQIRLPGRIDRLGTEETDGVFWIRKEFEVSQPDRDYRLSIGSIDDMDAIFINGKYVGGLMGEGNANTRREVNIPRGLLTDGRNMIAIRIIDTGGQGLVRGPMQLSDQNGKFLNLAGEWRCHFTAELVGNQFYSYGVQNDLSTRPDLSALNSNTPTALFNAMINPLIPYKIKGIIWYQGESNVGRAEQYKRLFPSMIVDWREKWRTNLPFYYVQIAPYLYTAPDQKEQSPALRNAQLYALRLSNTGMVSTLDIGYLKTAHPPYKQQVGERLARFALAGQYGKTIVASGPVYKRTAVSHNQIIVSFVGTGSGLVASDQGLFGFEIAGEDKQFVPALASIVSNRLIVTSPKVPKPLFVRYAWSDGAAGSLFNREGLPAATFTSEDERPVKH
jgi:sialate O-acetylesterase